MTAARLISLTAALVAAMPAVAADIFSSPTASDIPVLITSLGDPNVRFGASRALASLKTEAVTPLREALEFRTSEVRIWAAYTLGQIGPAAAPSIPALARVLTKSDSVDERRAAARALGQVTTGDAPDWQLAVQALTKALADPDDRVRLQSAAALGELGPLASGASGKLVLTFRDDVVRDAALTAVVAVGEKAIPTLLAKLEDDDLRFDCGRALRKISPEAARKAGVHRPTENDVRTLQLAVQNEARDAQSRIEAARQLGKLGVVGAPILVAAFSSPIEQVRRAAAAAFKVVGPDAIDLLAAALEDRSAQVRATAADALGAMGPDAKPAVAALVAALADTDRNVQHRVVSAFDALGASAFSAVPDLIKVMQNARVLEPTRQLALKVLVREATAKQRDTVIAALEESSRDRNFGISSLARVSLKKLREDSEQRGD